MSRSRWIPAVLAGVMLIAVLPSAAAAPPSKALPVPLVNKGQILVTVHPVEWIALGSNAIIANGLDVSLLSVAAPGAGLAAAAPALPTALYGKRLKLVKVQFCYDARDGGVALTQFLMRVDRNTVGTTKTNPVDAAIDVTRRTDQACRNYTVNWVLGPGDMAAASVTVDFRAVDERFEIGRLTFFLEPTNTAV